MKWVDVYYAMSGREQMQAALIGLAWITAGESGNAALLSSLLCNMMHPTGVCQTMDAAGVPVPPQALPMASPCCCGNYKPGKLTFGWRCPVHGQCF